jgi:hypothetical protein
VILVLAYDYSWITHLVIIHLHKLGTLAITATSPYCSYLGCHQLRRIKVEIFQLVIDGIVHLDFRTCLLSILWWLVVRRRLINSL